MRKCKARIVRTFKTRKAESCWPEDIAGQVLQDRINKYPECGGDVTLCVDIDYGNGCSCCSGPPTIEIVADCSRCATPFVGPDSYSFSYAGKDIIDRLLNA